MTALRQRHALAASILDHLIWSRVVARDLGVTAAVALAFTIADSLGPGAFVARGSHATN